MRRRGELIERSVAHSYETGAMRHTHLPRHENILKRQIYVRSFNLSLVPRRLIGAEQVGGRPEIGRFSAFWRYRALDRASDRIESAIAFVKAVLRWPSTHSKPVADARSCMSLEADLSKP